MNKKKKGKEPATPFHQSVPVCIKQIMVGKPSNAFVFLLQSYLQMEEELSNRLRQLYSRKYRAQQILAHICDRGGGIDG